MGRIEYVSSEDAEKGEFFVPRVIESFTLKKKPRETKDRTFPEKSDGQAIALYLGLRLAPNGGVAIFCGRKSTAASICKKAVATIDRGIPLPLPQEFSDQPEIERLHYLHVQNLGPEAPASKSAVHGIFSHHGNTPHGIRLAVEHAMREGLVRFVVCTSTLAQGVNLPIRYLIVTTVYQGLEQIKVRDFHNLIGRAGRAGMHTEGSILFADPVVYDKRRIQGDKWRWEQVKKLLEPRNSEPCISTLLTVFDPIKSDDKKFFIDMEALEFARAYMRDPEEVSRRADGIVGQHGDKGFTREGVERQIASKINLISSIESFLLSHWDKDETALSEVDVVRLAEETLAFFLADEQKREHIRELFKLLARNISANITDPGRRRVYGRTLYGVRDAQSIEGWVQANYAQLAGAKNEMEIIDVAWPLLASHIHNGVFAKFDKPDVLKEIAQEWIEGKPFYNLMETIGKKKARLIWGTRYRAFQIDDVVDLCEGGFAYDGSLLIGALSEVVELVDQEEGGELVTSLHLLQKQLKYGLPTEAAIALYELGFPDRVVAQNVATTMNVAAEGKRKIAQMVKKRQDRIVSVLEKYPRYFQQRMNDLL
ncbi:MAG: helicase-related protein [Phycisphaerae bacterium]|nr:helicase-related protein [Phycisphaerae bacterium]